jgi:hypothetical protein
MVVDILFNEPVQVLMAANHPLYLCLRTWYPRAF